MADEQREYRTHLYQLAQKAQESFDKYVLALSGGALGISFAFTERFLGAPPYRTQNLLIFAWIAWAVSILAILASFLSSSCALRKELARDNGSGTVKRNWSDTITASLNAIGGLSFSIGVVLMAIFVLKNLGGSR